jgi:hypothetical protein
MRSVAYWWVNQGQTWRHEVFGGFLWSPKRNRDGSRSVSYDAMTLVRPGDVVLSYFAGGVGAVGLVLAGATSSPKPDLGAAGSRWDDDGWEVVVQFEPLATPVDPRSLLPLYLQTREGRGPMNEGGQVTQAYLFPLAPAFGEALGAACGASGLEQTLRAGIEAQARALIEDAEAIRLDGARTRTERRQLALARVGQGIFKARVAELESRCRLTGVAQRDRLIASHVKPWREATDHERLDGANGLLLSPHVDHLFDRGLLTFCDDGRAVLSSAVPAEVVGRWHLAHQDDVRPFRSSQRAYLEYHRDTRFVP